jgi:hypothetical protein
MSEKLESGSCEIPLVQAKVWTEKYRKSKESDNATAKGAIKTNAYLIPLESLKLVMDQDIDAVRAYKGINNDGEQILMLVGTKLDPKTGIYRDVFKTGGSHAKSAEARIASDVVYDAVRPCPPNGDPESPL